MHAGTAIHMMITYVQVSIPSKQLTWMTVTRDLNGGCSVLSSTGGCCMLSSTVAAPTTPPNRNALSSSRQWWQPVEAKWQHDHQWWKCHNNSSGCSGSMVQQEAINQICCTVAKVSNFLLFDKSICLTVIAYSSEYYSFHCYHSSRELCWHRWLHMKDAIHK